MHQPDNRPAPEQSLVDSSQLARLIEVVDDWVNKERRKNGTVQPGVLATGLIIAGHVSASFPLRDTDVATPSQLRSQSGERVQSILHRYGEDRRFLSEGGRTSRKSRARGLELASRLNDAAASMSMSKWDEPTRAHVSEKLQEHLVGLVRRDYFEKQRLSADISAHLTVSGSIGRLLREASLRGGASAGAVAQHLVGAALEMRLPGEAIGMETYSTSDQQSSRAGDFQIGDAAIHVTMSPGDYLFSRRCTQNLEAGLRPIVLVPEGSVVAALQLASNAQLDGRVVVASIESFIGLSLEEASGYRGDSLRQQLRQLFSTYNKRVRQIEPDPSLLIEGK